VVSFPEFFPAAPLLGVPVDNPDTFSVVALSPLPSGYVVKFTDNAWTGTTLKTNEGTLQFTTSVVVTEGSMWTYDGATMTNAFGTWTKIQVSSPLWSDLSHHCCRRAPSPLPQQATPSWFTLVTPRVPPSSLDSLQSLGFL
jgi:hypothetical protein